MVSSGFMDKPCKSFSLSDPRDRGIGRHHTIYTREQEEQEEHGEQGEQEEQEEKEEQGEQD